MMGKHGMEEQEARVSLPRHPYTQEDAMRIAAVHNGRLLTERVEFVKQPRWQCSKGHRFSLEISKIIDKGRWCPICALHENLVTMKAAQDKADEAQIEGAMAVLYREFPQVFRPGGGFAVPFGANLFAEIYAVLDEKYPELSKAPFRKAVYHWCSLDPYRKACHTLGMKRYDVWGNIVGEVTEQQLQGKNLPPFEKVINERLAEQQRIAIYTDGSCRGDGRNTWAFAAYQQGEEIHTASGECWVPPTLPAHGGVVIVEMLAVIQAVCWLQASGYERAQIYHDNIYVGDLQGKLSARPEISQATQNYRACVLPLVKAGRLGFTHVTAHSGKWENERVDGLCTLRYDHLYVKGWNARRAEISRAAAFRRRHWLIRQWRGSCLRVKRWKRILWERPLRRMALRLGNKLVNYGQR
ncbi:ProQ/FINO family protein [Selenomonas sp. GACV-9]|uniref:ProQ/FINO family protein n=1 Tax=Selenomonas sp. GACV-9 TaxID=3158782 RepID=UPI0009EA5C7D